MSDLTKTTIKSKNPMAAKLTDLQKARNELAVAIKKYTSTQTAAAREAMQIAQAKVFQLEDEYRNAYFLLLQHECGKQGKS